MKLKVEIRNGEDIFFATRVDAKSGMWRLACFLLPSQWKNKLVGQS
jgi:hypothetical protein